MLNHLSKFQRERSRQNDYKKKYVLCVGIFITIGLFALSHTLEDYATFHINQNEIQSKKLLETGIRHGDWDFYPFVEDGKLPEFGIVMGGTSDLFKKPQGDLDLGTFSTCVNKLYAMKRQYAFKLATNLEDLSNRTYGGCSPKIRTMAPWNKILLVIKYLSDVKNLLWIDMDAVIVRPNIPINFILNASHKVESQLGGWLGTHSFNKKKHRFRSNMTGFSSEPFFWASQDINALYWVNLNTAVFVVKNVPLAFEFLRDVWAIGDNPDHFKKHDKAWEKKKECEGTMFNFQFKMKLYHIIFLLRQIILDGRGNKVVSFCDAFYLLGSLHEIFM